jgi:hypothetical protein
MSDVKVLDVTDKMRLLQWLYPDVYAKLVEVEDNDD